MHEDPLISFLPFDLIRYLIRFGREAEITIKNTQ